ncbi:hypothetical protein INR49_013010, partial [Caranx melampygus]
MNAFVIETDRSRSCVYLLWDLQQTQPVVSAEHTLRLNRLPVWLRLFGVNLLVLPADFSRIRDVIGKRRP